MKNTITRVDALNTAISFVSDHIDFLNEATGNDEEIKTMNTTMDVLTKIRDQIAKPRATSDETKIKRREANAKARAELCAQVVPILREVITSDMTAKEIFTAAQERLPKDFTANKVQAILLREMKDELVKTETKNKANTYRLAERG